jgi:hypothetical protein
MTIERDKALKHTVGGCKDTKGIILGLPQINLNSHFFVYIKKELVKLLLLNDQMALPVIPKPPCHFWTLKPNESEKRKKCSDHCDKANGTSYHQPFRLIKHLWSAFSYE